MKIRLAAICLTVGLVTLGMGRQSCWSQQQGYYPPAMNMQPGMLPAGQGGNMHYASQIPANMASPLAGGPAAATGGQFVDAHGNQIVMPANYCQSCPPGGYEGCSAMGGAYGDPMAVDFSGYTEDQIGPHYFDVAVDTVFLTPDSLLGAEIPAFTSYGIGLAVGQTINPFLDPSGQDEDYQAGWRVAMRYDLGALSVLEATYTGIYDLDFRQSVVSTQVGTMMPNQLFSIFSQYGFNPAGFINEFDQAQVHNLEYDSDLQSTEISYRRYWVGNNPRVSGTYLLGARYVRMTEDLVFSAEALNGSGFLGTDSENDLVGFQFGGDGWIGVRQGLRFGCEGKAGVYNNRFKFNSNSNVTSVSSVLQPAEDGNQVAFVAEGGASFVADILPSWSVRGGYQVMYINELVLVGNNFSSAQFASVPVTPAALATGGHALYHGFHAGLEYVW